MTTIYNFLEFKSEKEEKYEPVEVKNEKKGLIKTVPIVVHVLAKKYFDEKREEYITKRQLAFNARISLRILGMFGGHINEEAVNEKIRLEVDERLLSEYGISKLNMGYPAVTITEVSRRILEVRANEIIKEGKELMQQKRAGSAHSGQCDIDERIAQLDREIFEIVEVFRLIGKR